VAPAVSVIAPPVVELFPTTSLATGCSTMKENGYVTTTRPL
jgi:hypothetical protein